MILTEHDQQLLERYCQDHNINSIRQLLTDHQRYQQFAQHLGDLLEQYDDVMRPE